MIPCSLQMAAGCPGLERSRVETPPVAAVVDLSHQAQMRLQFYGKKSEYIEALAVVNIG